MNHRICKKCGWVHFAVTRAQAEKEVKTFNNYFNTLTDKEKQDYYGEKGSSIELYEYCNVCKNSCHNFRKAKKSEIPYGSTLSPIIYER